MMDDTPLLVLTTVNTLNDAHFIADNLLEKQLAACINIMPHVEACYRWKGKIVHDNEFLLIIKTIQLCFDELLTHLQAIHPYELPEIISIPIQDGHPSYLQWLRQACQ